MTRKPFSRGAKDAIVSSPLAWRFSTPSGRRFRGVPKASSRHVGGPAVQETELDRWLRPPETRSAGPPRNGFGRCAAGWRRPLEPPDGAWRIVAVRSVVVGPERFNRRLAELDSKARVHFTAFRELLELAWDLAADGRPTRVRRRQARRPALLP